jgi:hypothetical protein
VLSTPACRMTSVSSAEALTFCSQVEQELQCFGWCSARPGGEGLARSVMGGFPVPGRIQESVVEASRHEVRYSGLGRSVFVHQEDASLSVGN